MKITRRELRRLILQEAGMLNEQARGAPAEAGNRGHIEGFVNDLQSAMEKGLRDAYGFEGDTMQSRDSSGGGSSLIEMSPEQAGRLRREMDRFMNLNLRAELRKIVDAALRGE